MSRSIFAKNLFDVSRFASCPPGWREVSVGDLSRLGRGRVISEDEIASHPGPYPVYSSQTSNGGEMGRMDSFAFEGEWITWTTDGANAGTVFYRNGKFNCTNVCGTIQPKDAEGLDLPFLAYHLGRIAKNYVSYIGNPKLMNDVMGRVALVLPPSHEQRKIARILTTVDSLIEKTEALIAKYQAIKQGMMHDLFTRGVDEHEQLRPPYEEAPELYKQSELGWIPKEWEAIQLTSVVPRAEYGISTSMSEEPEGIPVLRMNNLKNGRFSLSDLKYSRSTEANCLQLNDGDVLFNRTNSIDHVGRTSIWRGELPAASFASYLVRLVPDVEHITPLFLTLWLNLPSTQIAIRRYATPSVHQVNINPTNLRSTLIRIPCAISEQNAITDAVVRINRRLDSEESVLCNLRVLKAGLMQDLLTGKVRVKVEAEDMAHV